MKKVFCLFCLILSVLFFVSKPINSQVSGSLIFFEDFSDTIFPKPGWIVSGVSRTTTANSFVSPPAALSIGSFNGFFTLPAVNHPAFLRFELGRTTTTTLKLLIVEVSVESQSTGFIPLDTFDHDNTISNGFTLCETDLIDYSGFSEVWVRFRKVSSTTSPWRLDDIEIYNAPLLPVELSSFTADFLMNKGVELKWETASEQNNAYFIVQNSSDGKTFINREIVYGAGTSYYNNSYNYLDLNPPFPTAYYRLLQTDFDGTITPSNVLQVNTSSKINTDLEVTKIYATSDGIKAVLCNPDQPYLKISVIDIRGVKIYEENITDLGCFDISINTKLSGGVFVIHVVGFNQSTARKFSVNF